jgi:hypothetical protein
MNDTIREVTEEPKVHEGMSADEHGAILLVETLRTLLRWKVEIVTYKGKFYVIRN